MEVSCLRTWRAELMGRASGDVLEIGSGTGANLPYYPGGLRSLTLSEPDPQMLRRLQRKTVRSTTIRHSLTDLAVEQLDFPAASFDTIVSTLVLCSVPSPSAALATIRRLLKPNGQLLVLEHVVAGDNPRLRKWQQRFEPFWTPLCGNCHLTRDTEQLIRAAGFDFETLEHLRSSGGPTIVSPTIMGVARPSGRPTRPDHQPGSINGSGDSTEGRFHDKLTQNSSVPERWIRHGG